jgi:hypothetical protein
MEGGHRFAQASSADSGSPVTPIILLLEWVATWNPSAIYYMSATPSRIAPDDLALVDSSMGWVFEEGSHFQ